MTTQPTDDDLDKLAQAARAALSHALAGDDAVSIELLPAHQLFVSRHLVAGPQGGKAPRQVPAEDGYTLYVRFGSGVGAGSPRQRSAQAVDLAVTDLAASTLKLHRAGLDQTWQLRCGPGLQVVVTARSGSAQGFDGLDRTLAALDAALRQVAPPSGH